MTLPGDSRKKRGKNPFGSTATPFGSTKKEKKGEFSQYNRPSKPTVTSNFQLISNHIALKRVFLKCTSPLCIYYTFTFDILSVYKARSSDQRTSPTYQQQATTEGRQSALKQFNTCYTDTGKSVDDEGNATVTFAEFKNEEWLEC